MGLLTRFGIAYWYFRYQEFRRYRVSDVIGVQSLANLTYFSGLPARVRSKTEVLLNWTNVRPPSAPTGAWRRKFGVEGKVVFVYGGVLGLPQDVDNLVRLAAAMRNERDAYFLLVGEGSEADRIRREIEGRGLTNIVVHPAVSQEEYMEIVSESDVGLITLRRDLKTHNFPGKMLSYMQAGKPILASINPGNDLGEIAMDSGSGYACSNGDDALLHRYARELTRDSNLRRRMGENARKLLADKFDVSVAVRPA